MTKQFTVQFCWYMPVIAHADVEAEEGTSVADIVNLAMQKCEDEGWSNQEDVLDGITDTFVESILDEDGGFVEIPFEWTEAAIINGEKETENV